LEESIRSVKTNCPTFIIYLKIKSVIMKKFHYVYLTTNLINGKQYVGDHSTNNLNDNYKGSGILLRKKFKQYRKENFKKEILEFFGTKQEAFNAQEKWINDYNTLVPNGYNISPKGGLHISGCHSKETIEKIRKGNLGKSYKHTEETKKLISIGLTNRPASKKVVKNMSKVGKSNKGKKRSEEFKENLRKLCQGNKEYGKGSAGKVWVFNKEINKSIKIYPEEFGKYSKLGWQNGRKFSKEHKQKLKEAALKRWS